jgi:hypothetical protein
MILKLESAGLGYHVSADETEDKLGNVWWWTTVVATSETVLMYKFLGCYLLKKCYVYIKLGQLFFILWHAGTQFCRRMSKKTRTSTQSKF